MNNGNLTDAIEAVSTMDIVEHFGIPYQERRGRIYLLCPGHTDNHFGSCYVDKNDNGYYCYVCAEHVRKWDMLKKVSGYNNTDARDWFFRVSGITPSKQANPLIPILQLIKDIGPFINNSTVYNDIHACEKQESSYGRIEQGEYLYSEPACAKPLLELYKTDSMLFAEVTKAALKTRIAEHERVIAFCNRHAKDKCIINGALQYNPKYQELKSQCEETIENINKLIIRIDTL